MLDNGVFEKFEIWPVSFSILNKKVYTLWASDIFEKDCLLAYENTILFFKNLKQLNEYIIENKPCNYKQIVKKFNAFRSCCKDNNITGSKCDNLNFRKASLLLESFDIENWTIDDCSTVLDVLNMLWDCHYTIKSDLFKDKTCDGSTMIMQLMDELTFYNPNEQIDTDIDCKKWYDKRIAYNCYSMLVGKILLNSEIF